MRNAVATVATWGGFGHDILVRTRPIEA
jgi:hypothetical protein